MPNSTQARAGWYGSYLYQRRGIFASSAVPPGIKSYTFDHRSVAPDANGRRFVPQGTTLMSYGSTGHASPRTTGVDAIGILDRDIDATDSDQEIGLVVRGVVNEKRLWDLGVFGSVDATNVKTALKFIQFVSVDL